MNSKLKNISKDKQLLFVGLIILLFVVFVAATSKGVRIIDKTTKLMRSSTLKYTTRSLNSINQIFVHHSASIGQTAEDYARYHVQSKGWAGIGYHFVIEINGDIIQCNPLINVSYNVSGHNTRSIGICLSGDFTQQEPTAAQLKSLANLIKHLRKELPQYLAVNGHKEYGQTSCPGSNLEKHLYKFQAA
jgi:N-acetyl-anhydromuramyl-L-alanine amidase AmpD